MNKKLKELFVKLKYVFPRDMILLKNRYAVAGKKSYEKNFGFNLAILEPEQEGLIEEFFKGNTLIKDVNKTKEYVEEKHQDIYWEEYNEKGSEHAYEIIQEVLKEVDGVKEWKHFTDHEDFLEYIITKKGIYNLPIDGTNEMIRIGKEALPMFTMKNASQYQYHIRYDEKINLYVLLIKICIPHFQLYLHYRAVPMHTCEND